MELQKYLKFGSLVILLDLLKIFFNVIVFDSLVIVFENFPIHLLW